MKEKTCRHGLFYCKICNFGVSSTGVERGKVSEIVKRVQLDKGKAPISAKQLIHTAAVLSEKLCSKCRERPRAPWSDSWCRECYAAWKKERRKGQNEDHD